MFVIIRKLFKRTRRRKFLTLIFLAVLTGVTILNTDLAPDLYFVNFEPLEDVSCHYTKTKDDLPSAERLYPPQKSIFFHETSCKGYLDSRQACAVESAARAHPDWQINVLFAAPVTNFMQQRSLMQLRKFANVKFARVHLTNYAKGTPLEAMVLNGALNRTRWRISHTSDVLRYLTLYKWGGVYLDLDVIVAKPLDALGRNFAARESSKAVAAGVLAFSRDIIGRNVAAAAISDIQRSYRGDIWGHNGPGVITRVLRRLCATADASDMSAATCHGFEVYGPQFFYPIKWQRGEIYFQPGELNVNNAYVYHVWNRVTQQYKVVEDCPYAKLAKRFCPTIYEIIVNDFGL